MRLIIAEKPIAAERIAEILASRPVKHLKEEGAPLFDIGEFRGEPTLVIPLKGHILDVDYPSKFNNWRATPLEDLVTAPLEYKPSAAPIVKLLKKYASKCDHLTIACDFDTEGEAIGKEAIRVILDAGKTPKIDRSRFSAITSDEIKESFSPEHIVAVDYNLADSADARREIDLIWGAVLTRFMSLHSGRMGHSFLSVGRVQSPTLSLIVDRFKERNAFKSQKYWVISGIFEKDAQKFEAVHKQDKFDDPGIAAEVFARLKSKLAAVANVEHKEKKLSPPTPFNTTDFLRAAANMGVGLDRAMSIAEKLYMEGYTSYPRTDNTYYPEVIDLREVLDKLAPSPEFGADVQKVAAQKALVPTHGKKKATDHPPIYPVALAPKSKLSDLEWKVYELIVRRFLATLSPVCEVYMTRVTLDLDKEIFYATGQIIRVPGWKAVYPYSKSEDVELPAMRIGDQCAVIDLKNEEKETKPKPNYTPSALIKAMEDLNLGTKSTRPAIIQKLQDRQYITGTKNYEPTPIAVSVTESLEKYAMDISKPTMTSALEDEMQEIAEGKKPKPTVVDDSRKMLSAVLVGLQANRGAIGTALSGVSQSSSVVGKCEKCGGDLRIIRSQRSGKQFVGCSGYSKGCTNSFPLPQQGRISSADKACEFCKAPVVLVERGARSFEMCIRMGCESKKDWGQKKATAASAPAAAGAEGKSAAKKPRVTKKTATGEAKPTAPKKPRVAKKAVKPTV